MKLSLSKKTVLASFTVILVFSACFSSYSQLTYGFKAGYGMNKLSGGDLYGGINWKSGVTGGLIIGYKFKTDFNFQSEILFDQSGMNQKFIQINRTVHDEGLDRISEDSTFTYDNSLNLTYVKVPLLLKKSFSFKGGTYPFLRSTSTIDLDVFAGPYVSYLISASSKFSTKVAVKTYKNGTNTKTETETAINDKYHNSFHIGQSGDTSSLIPPEFLQPRPALSDGIAKLDVGISVGLGLSFELNARSKLTIDARYSMGLLSIDNGYFSNKIYTLYTLPDGSTGYKATVNKLDLKNSSINAFLGYIIYLD
jgi:hypothetical protein